MHHYRQALLRMRQGDSDRDIAAARVMGRPKAAQWRRIAAERGWLDTAQPLPDDETIAAALGSPRKASTTISTLEAHRSEITAWVEQSVSGTAIHAALKRRHGWAGSYSAVRRLVADIRRQLPPETTCRLDFEPGDAAQVDFGAGPTLLHPDGQPRRTWAFVMTLAHSRHQYVEFVWDQTVPTWLGCHRRAFEWFAGVPARIIIDNAKCAITRACAQDPTVQRAYAECAEGYGFKIDPCPPYDPQKKGIVESGVKYLKGNFLPLRTFRDLADLNAQVRAWVLQEAGVRCHGTTRRTPLALFALEAPLLHPLPAQAPDLGSWHRVSVHRDCHVQFERVLYSAPFTLVGKTLWLRATDAAVVYDRMRTVVLGTEDGKPRLNTTFAAFARHWGFTPRLCQPYRAQTKGKVESGVKYLKRNFAPGRSYRDLEDFNSQLMAWQTGVADLRVHGTTHQRPIDRFAEEAAALAPTASQASFLQAMVRDRVVADDWLISLDANRYSVPCELIGRTVQVVREGGDWVIRHRGEVVARHAVLAGRAQLSVDGAHSPAARRSRPALAIVTPAAPGHALRSLPIPLDIEVEIRDLQVYDELQREVA